PNKVQKVNQILAFLEEKSRELHSELNAHFSFAQRLAHAQKNANLLVKEGTLLLRATGYLEEDLAREVFGRLASEDMRNMVDEVTGLRVEAIRPAAFLDIFDTVLGEQYLEQIIFELPTEDDALTFKIHGKDYAMEMFQVCLT